MPSCGVPGCQHRYGRESCRFIKVPVVRLQLPDNLRRELKHYQVVCNCHFENGDKTRKWVETRSNAARLVERDTSRPVANIDVPQSSAMLNVVVGPVKTHNERHATTQPETDGEMPQANDSAFYESVGGSRQITADVDQDISDNNIRLDSETIQTNSNMIHEIDESLFHRRPLRPAWNPNISILELAYKLKRAEQNVFGIRSKSESFSSHFSNRLKSFRDAHVNKTGVISSLNFDADLGYNRPDYDGNGSAFAHVFFGDRSENSNTEVPASEISKGHIPLPHGTGSFTSSPVTSLPFPNRPRYTNSDASPVPVSLVSVRSNGSLLQQPVNTQLPTFIGNDADWSVEESDRSFDDDCMQTDEISNESNAASEIRHRCKQCCYSTKSMHHLRRHCATVHTDTKPYQCYICLEEFARSERAREHFTSMHPDVLYEPRMVRKFSPPGSANTVRETAPTMDTKSRIRELFRDIEGEDMEFETDSERPFGCLRCSYAARDLWHLRRHVLDVHAVSKQHNCPICRYATNRSNRLNAHMRSHGEMFCSYCSFSTSSLSYFTLHDRLCASANVMAPSSPLVCQICRQRSDTRDQLFSHFRDVHSLEVMKCSECSYSAYNTDDYNAHVGTHSAMRRTCKLCGETFECSEYHDEHDEQVHLVRSNGFLECRVCGLRPDSSRGPEGLRAHVRSHSPEKFSCPHSGCRFTATLQQSVDMHGRYYHGTSQQLDLETPKRPSNQLPQRPTPSLARVPITIAPKNNLQADQFVGTFGSSVRAVPSPACLLPSPIPTVVRDSLQVTPMVGTFTCSVCGPKRMPFKYWRSYEKHMAQHGLEAMPKT